MGNNEGLHYVSLLPIITLERGDECRVIMSSFLHIITYYYILLHIVAFANTMCDLVLTGPRASTPDVLASAKWGVRNFRNYADYTHTRNFCVIFFCVIFA